MTDSFENSEVLVQKLENDTLLLYDLTVKAWISALARNNKNLARLTARKIKRDMEEILDDLEINNKNP